MMLLAELDDLSDLKIFRCSGSRYTLW